MTEWSVSSSKCERFPAILTHLKSLLSTGWDAVHVGWSLPSRALLQNWQPDWTGLCQSRPCNGQSQVDWIHRKLGSSPSSASTVTSLYKLIHSVLPHSCKLKPLIKPTPRTRPQNMWQFQWTGMPMCPALTSQHTKRPLLRTSNWSLRSSLWKLVTQMESVDPLTSPIPFSFVFTFYFNICLLLIGQDDLFFGELWQWSSPVLLHWCGDWNYHAEEAADRYQHSAIPGDIRTWSLCVFASDKKAYVATLKLSRYFRDLDTYNHTCYFQMAVRAFDKGTPVMSADASVTVTVHRDQFLPEWSSDNYRQSVNEDARNGTAIYSVKWVRVLLLKKYEVTSWTNDLTCKRGHRTNCLITMSLQWILVLNSFF